MINLIEKNGKHYQEGNVKILPAKESFLFQEDDGTITYHEKSVKSDGIGRAIHLCITSNEEIKEGDWFIGETNIIKKCFKINKIHTQIHTKDVYAYFIHKCKKVIATTNTSIMIGTKDNGSDDDYIRLTTLCFPRPSEEFINSYIKSHNLGKQIDKVLIEVEIDEINELSSGNTPSIHQLKTKNNIINIITSKDTWSREEVSHNLIYCVSEIAAKLGFASTSDEMKIWNSETNLWIDNNL